MEVGAWARPRGSVVVTAPEAIAAPQPVEDQIRAWSPHAVRKQVYNDHALFGALSPFELKAAAQIPGVLLTAVDTVRSGPVIATVAHFDRVSGRHCLLHQKARLVGQARLETAPDGA